MNNRKRKKWLKKHNLYINPRDTWNMDYTIAEYVLPRLKEFKKVANGYPGTGDADTPEKWDEIMDKMITAFEYVKTSDGWWIGDPRYDASAGLHITTEILEDGSRAVHFEEEDWCEPINKAKSKEYERRQQAIEEGMHLFAKWFQHLWW